MYHSGITSKNDSRTPTVRAVAKLIELLLGFGFIGALWVFSAQAIDALQAARCPVTAFASGSPRVASIFMMLAPGFASIGIGLVVANVMTGSLPATRGFFDGDANFRKSRSFKEGQALLVRLALALAVAGLFASFVASRAQFCLTPNAILDRGAPWEPMRSYPWNAVQSVTTSCTRGSKDGWDEEYELGFSDGRHLDILGGATGNAWKSQRQIFDALRPVSFRFDASRVVADCDVGDVDMLLKRP